MKEFFLGWEKLNILVSGLFVDYAFLLSSCFGLFCGSFEVLSGFMVDFIMISYLFDEVALKLIIKSCDFNFIV